MLDLEPDGNGWRCHLRFSGKINLLPIAGGGRGRGRHRKRAIFDNLPAPGFIGQGAGAMSMRRFMLRLLVAASMSSVAVVVDAASDEWPAEPLVRISTIVFESQDTYQPSSLLCGDRLLYVSTENDYQWFAVDLTTNATTPAYADLPYGIGGCSPSGRWIEFRDADGRDRIGANDDPLGSAGFQYKNVILLWAENADVLFLMRGESYGWNDGIAADSPVDASTPFEVFYVEPAAQAIERTLERYGGASVLRMIWQPESNELVARTGSGKIVVLGFGASRQIETLNEVLFSMPEGSEISLDWDATHVEARQVYGGGELATDLLLADRDYLESDGPQPDPLSFLLCEIERYLADCIVRPWQPPHFSGIHSILQIHLKTPSPVDLTGSMIGFHQLSDRSGCLAVWVGTEAEPLTCLTQTYTISESHYYSFDVDIRPEMTTLTVFDTDLEAGTVAIELYRVDYETLRELGVDG